MGQQPLLLMILLLLIGGGDPVADSIRMFPEKAASANRNAVCNDLFMIATSAHQYYSRPAGENGGGNSFIGLTCDAAGSAKIMRMAGYGNNANGTYCIEAAGTAHSVVIQGVGTASVGYGNHVTVRIVVRDQGRADSLYQVY